MAGPVLRIDLPGPVAEEQLLELGTLLRGLSSYFQEERIGSFDVGIVAGRLGAGNLADDGDARPFSVIISGPGFGDEETFEAEHAEDPDLETLIGFTPTHEVAILAGCNRQVDHLMVAELTATIHGIVGGIIDAELCPDKVDEVRDLPGLVAIVEDRWPCALGTADFLRNWASTPGFRLVK